MVGVGIFIVWAFALLGKIFWVVLSGFFLVKISGVFKYFLDVTLCGNACEVPIFIFFGKKFGDGWSLQGDIFDFEGTGIGGCRRVKSDVFCCSGSTSINFCVIGFKHGKVVVSAKVLISHNFLSFKDIWIFARCCVKDLGLLLREVITIDAGVVVD